MGAELFNADGRTDRPDEASYRCEKRTKNQKMSKLRHVIWPATGYVIGRITALAWSQYKQLTLDGCLYITLLTYHSD